MPFTITMPALSPTMEEGVIAKWHKKEGDQVSSGDVLCEITTDKSTVEFEAIDEGYLRKIVVQAGSEAKVNQGIAILTESADEDISNYTLEEPDLVKEEITQEQSEDTGEKAPPTSAPKGGVLHMMSFAPAPPRDGYVYKKRGGAKASPLAKKIAKEKGLDLTSVAGSGPGGRILEKDLKMAQSASTISFGEKEKPALAPGTYEEEDLSPVRKVIGERLQASKMTIPHAYIRDEIRADRMMDLRLQLKEAGLKFTFNDFVIRAAAIALREHPEINSGYNSKDQKIIRYKTVDISLAVSIPDGLITPVICHADYKNLVELSSEAKSLAKRAKENSLQPEEYQGGSFTVSNLGMFGISSFDAVINPPQAAILAVGGISERAIVEKGTCRVGHVMQVCLSVDHRVVDGAEAAKFLVTLKKYLLNPSLLVV